MIVPMKKIALVVLEKERKDALKRLRKLGVVQLEEVQGSSDELQACRDQSNKVTKAISLLSDTKVPKQVAKRQKKLEKDAALGLAATLVQQTEQKKGCYDRITAARNDLERLQDGVMSFPKKSPHSRKKACTCRCTKSRPISTTR